MKGLSNKRVIVTGAGGGIGRAICKRFAEAGSVVLATDIDEASLEETRQVVTELGAQCDASVFDISNYEQVQDATAAWAGTHGGFDVLVNNAGWDIAVEFLKSDPAIWQRLIAINLYGPLNLQHCVVKRMVDDGGGKVINIASDAGRVGSSGEAVYSACKGGMISFSKSLARELARANVCVNAVCPGPTETRLLESFVGEGEYGKKIYEGLKRAIPMRRLGQPEDLAGIVAFLASDEAGFITGQTISVSGGLTMHG